MKSPESTMADVTAAMVRRMILMSCGIGFDFATAMQLQIFG